MITYKQTYYTKSAQDTQKVAMKIAANIKGGEALCLFGELGSGKTTFTRGFINYFKKNARVLSPTFIIVRHYRINHKLISGIIHADLYRMENINEISNLGLVDLLNKKSVLLVEWPEKLNTKHLKKRIDIKFNIVSDNERKIAIEHE